MPISLSILRNKTALGTLASLLLLSGTAMAHHEALESFTAAGAVDSSASTGSFSIADFDSSLGTLESVTLTLNLNSTPTIQVYNLSSSSENFLKASQSVTSTITGAGLVLNSTIKATLDSGVAQAGLNTFTLDPFAKSASAHADPAQLALWQDQASGFVSFSFSKSDATFGGTDVGGQNLLFGGTLGGTGDVTVHYHYLTSCPPLTTPEPAGVYFTTLAAAAMAALALGRFRSLRA